MTGDAKTPRFTSSGFFVLRSPLLPLEELTTWGEGLEAVGALGDGDGLEVALARDRARLRERLLAAFARRELRDAVFVASPSVDEAFDVWRNDPDSKRGRRLEAALVSYFTRAAARATPFGLFAGCTTGTIGARTRLQLQPRDRYQRHSRLDMDYLWALAEAVERDRRLRQTLLFEPNSSLYEVAGRLRLAQGRVVDNAARITSWPSTRALTSWRRCSAPRREPTWRTWLPRWSTTRSPRRTPRSTWPNSSTARSSSPTPGQL